MTLPIAKKTFAHLMQVSRTRPLGTLEKRALITARQTIRKHRKPAMNPKKRNPLPPGDYQEFSVPRYLTAGAKKQITNLKKQGWVFLKTFVYPSGKINHHLTHDGRTAMLKEDGTIYTLYPVGTSVYDALKGKQVTQGYGSEPNPGKKRNPNPGHKRGKIIYRDITRIEGTKGPDSQYAGQKFFHNFKRPYPEMIGLPDGSLLIRSKR